MENFIRNQNFPYYVSFKFLPLFIQGDFPCTITPESKVKVLIVSNPHRIFSSDHDEVSRNKFNFHLKVVSDGKIFRVIRNLRSKVFLFRGKTCDKLVKVHIHSQHITVRAVFIDEQERKYSSSERRNIFKHWRVEFVGLR